MKVKLSLAQFITLKSLQSKAYTVHWYKNDKGVICYTMHNLDNRKSVLYLTMTMRALVNKGLVALHPDGECILTPEGEKR